jgi:ankyrin repeat protein/predicted DNA-binding WGR domain protein
MQEEDMSSRELWLIRRKVKKFWKIQLSGKSYTVVTGLAGTEGRTTTKKFASEVEAEGAYLKAIATAFTKGYREGEEQLPGIWQAFADWDVAAVREYLRADPELAKTRGPEGETPLHSAVQHRRHAMAKLLLEHGADVNAQGGEDKETPFGLTIDEFDAGNKNAVRTVEVLLSYHPDLSIKDRWGQTLLQRATRDEDLGKLLERHGIAANLDSAAKLIKALEEKGIPYVQKQLAANPQLLRDPKMADVLEFAVSWGDRAHGFVSFLLDNGADPNWTSQGRGGPVRPLIECAVLGANRPKIVRLLLERGADLKRLKNGGRALLESAIYVRANKEIINDLIRFGVKKDLHIQLKMDGAKKIFAQIKENPALIQELDDPVEFLNQAMGNEELVETLLTLGVDPNSHGPDQDAPLRLAVKNANVKLVRLLLDHGADPNPRDRAWHQASGRYGTSVMYEGWQESQAERRKAIIDLLIARGAKTDEPARHEEWMKRLEAIIARRARKKKK